MRILITGATGFVGKYLVQALQNTPHHLILLVRKTIEEVIASGNCTVISLTDINWKQSLQAAKPEVVIHLASYLTSADDEPAIERLIASNLTFGAQLLNALQSTGLQYFINTGTFAEYLYNDGLLEPAYLYAATKTAFRSILKYYQSVTGFKTIHIIPYTIYGGSDSKKKLIDYIYESTLTNVPLKMSPGEQVLDFIHIDDVVGFFLSLIANIDKAEEPVSEIHLGTGIGTTPREIAAIIESITERAANIEWGGLPYRKRDTMYSVASETGYPAYLNWKPLINIQNGLDLYINRLDKEK
jgi:CDP-paratose synthetase